MKKDKQIAFIELSS